MKFRTRAGVVVTVGTTSVEFAIGGKGLCMAKVPFNDLFEPIPAEPDDTVEVKKEDLTFVIWIAEQHYGPGFETSDGTVRRLRAALGEKEECEHKDRIWTTDRDDQGCIMTQRCEACGATRTLGEWIKPEKTK